MDNSANSQNNSSEGRLYKSSLCYMWPFAIMGYVASGFLIYQGFKGLKMYPAEIGDPFRYISGYVPICLAALVILGTTWMFIKNSGRRIGLTKKYFLYRTFRNSKMKKIPWDRLSINAPDESKAALFRTAYITDGTTSMLIERCFFPEFDEMCENIQELTKAARGRN